MNHQDLTPMLRMARSWTSHGAVALVGLAACLIPSDSQASYPEPVIRIEEDWIMVLYEPNDALTAPQFYTVMSPYGHLESYFAQVTWNYQEVPDFTSGGMQIQAWDSEYLVTDRSFATEMLSATAETIRWTQVLSTDGSKLTFTIKNGQSSTWGAFGYPAENMKIQATAALPNLSGYDPELTRSNSGISFGSNRVDSLKIAEVRYYGPSGLLNTDTTPKVVFDMD